MKTGVLFFLTIFPILSVCAQTVYTGSKLQEERRVIVRDIDSLTPEQRLSAVACSAYVRAVLDTVSIWHHWEPKTASEAVKKTCVPREVSAEQAAKLVLKYLDAHP